MGKTINVTPQYRIAIKDEYNIVIELAGPSRPNPFKPDEPFIEKTVWREVGCYGYTLNGLSTAIKAIILRAALDGLAESSELTEFHASLVDVAAKIDTAFSPDVTVKLAVFDAG